MSYNNFADSIATMLIEENKTLLASYLADDKKLWSALVTRASFMTFEKDASKQRNITNHDFEVFCKEGDLDEELKKAINENSTVFSFRQGEKHRLYEWPRKILNLQIKHIEQFNILLGPVFLAKMDAIVFDFLSNLSEDCYRIGFDSKYFSKGLVLNRGLVEEIRKKFNECKNDEDKTKLQNEIQQKIALKLQPQLIELIWFELIWAGKITKILPVPASANELVGQINSINDSRYSNATSKRGSELKIKIMTILLPIGKKARELSGNEAAILRTLYTTIVLYSVDFDNNKNIDDFKNHCMQAINKAQKELPPDYKKLLGNLALAVLGLVVFYLMAIIINKSLNGRFLFFKTETDSLKEHVNSIKTLAP